MPFECFFDRRRSTGGRGLLEQNLVMKDDAGLLVHDGEKPRPIERAISGIEHLDVALCGIQQSVGFITAARCNR